MMSSTRPSPFQFLLSTTTMSVFLLLLLVFFGLHLSSCLTLGAPIPLLGEGIVEDGMVEIAEVGSPDWWREAGWLGFRNIREGRRPHLPESYEHDWHVVNSPTRGLVTDQPARLRLGIIAKESHEALESHIAYRIPAGSERGPQIVPTASDAIDNAHVMETRIERPLLSPERPQRQLNRDQQQQHWQQQQESHQRWQLQQKIQQQQQQQQLWQQQQHHLLQQQQMQRQQQLLQQQQLQQPRLQQQQEAQAAILRHEREVDHHKTRSFWPFTGLKKKKTRQAKAKFQQE